MSVFLSIKSSAPSTTTNNHIHYNSLSVVDKLDLPSHSMSLEKDERCLPFQLDDSTLRQVRHSVNLSLPTLPSLIRQRIRDLLS